MIRELQNERFY